MLSLQPTLNHGWPVSDNNKRPHVADDGEHWHKRQAVMLPPQRSLSLASPISLAGGPPVVPAVSAVQPVAARTASFEFLPNTAATPSLSTATDRGDACRAAPASAPSFGRQAGSCSEVTLLGAFSSYSQQHHSYVEQPTAELSLQAIQPAERANSLCPALPVAEAVLPLPAADPESNVFRPAPMLHLNGQALQHLAILKEMRTKVANALKHRISRRVSAGKLSEQAAEVMQKAIFSRLVKPVSLALQRYCAAKRYFAEGQACLAHVKLSEGFGALGLFSKDVTALTDNLANAITKAAVQAEAAFVEQQQERELELVLEEQQQREQQQDTPRCSRGGSKGRTISDAGCSWQQQSPAPSLSPSTLDALLPAGKLVCRQPAAEPSQRTSFCGSRTVVAGEAPHAAQPALSYALPSTPRSADTSAGACAADRPLSLSPAEPLTVQLSEEQSMAVQDQAAGGCGTLDLQQAQSVANEEQAHLRLRCGSTTATVPWAIPETQRSQVLDFEPQLPLHDSAGPDAVLEERQHHEQGAEQQAQEGTSYAEVASRPAEQRTAGAGAQGAVRPASSFVSSASPPPAHLSASSAESPNRGSAEHDAAAEPWAWVRVDGQQKACSNEEKAGANTPEGVVPLPHKVAMVTPRSVDVASANALDSPMETAMSQGRDSQEGLAVSGVAQHGGPAERSLEAGAVAPPNAAAVSAAETEAAHRKRLSDVLAPTFMEGLEAVDWYVVVQDAYGVDPEELLLQQRGLEEGQDDEEADERPGWTRRAHSSIQGAHRH